MAAIIPERLSRSVRRVGLTGVIVVGAIVAVQFKDQLEGAAHCLTNIKSCLDPHFSVDKDQPKAPAFGDFKKDSEQLTATVGVQSFGQAQIVVQGIGHLNYKNPDWFKQHVPFDDHADGTVFLNKKPVSLSYEPCIVDTNNYAEDVLHTTGETTAQTGQIKLTTKQALDGQTYVDVNAGAIAACDMRIDVTTQNAGMFRIKDQMGNGQLDSFMYEADTMLIDYAQANSCPESIISLTGAQSAIATVARGYMAASPNAEWRSLATGPVTVEISDPLQEHELLELHLFADAVRFHNTTESLPDSKDRTHKMDPATFTNFAEVSCAQPVLQVAPAA
jgi:hypothetical protein